MTEQQFIADIKNEITFSGALPYAIPDAEIKKIIENAKAYFYDNWRHALEPRYIPIPQEIFSTPQFKSTRTISLPECVMFIHLLKEIGGQGYFFGTSDKDFSDQKFIGSELMLSPFLSDGLTYMTVMMSFIDLSKSFTTEGNIQWHYNKNEKRLSIMGRVPHAGRGIVIKAMVKIGDDGMYRDEMFQRYVRAKAKIRLAHMLSSFEFNLPGGVKINYTNMLTQAEKEFDKVIEDMKGENTPDWMLFYH
jgi:hypothetical protein